MNAHMFDALEGLENRLNSLISSLTTSPTAASAPAAAVALLNADDAVSSALGTLRTHQANYMKILRLRAEAEGLEERIKSIVRDISGMGKEITDVTGDDDDYNNSEEEDEDTDTEDEDYDNPETASLRKRKEVDYRLLLDFARRISKYNKEAAADAAAGTDIRVIGKGKSRGREQTGGDAEMTDANGEVDRPDEPVAAVTKDATNWLDESAHQARQIYMIPYPSEDRIRMGLMGQLQMAANERPGLDPEKEAERMVREAEGTGAAGGIPTVNKTGADEQLADTAARAAADVGSTTVDPGPQPTGGTARVHAPAPRPKATLDLDLYDPDNDD